jgi:hypothetical protein
MPIIGIIASSKKTGLGVAGYFAAGIGTGGTNLTSVAKYLYSTDTTSTLSGTVTGRYSRAGLSNYDTAGYFLNGYVAGVGSTGASEKMPFVTETISVLSNTANHAEASAMTNSGTAGYQGGGWGGSSDVATVLKWNYSNDTESTGANNLAAAARLWMTYANNKGERGYYGGDFQGTTMWYYAFSNETTSTIAATFSVANFNYSNAVSDEGTSFITTAGDFTNAGNRGLNKVPFSTETRTTLSATTTIGPNGATTNLGSYGLFLSYDSTTTNKLTYSTDTISTGTAVGVVRTASFSVSYAS